MLHPEFVICALGFLRSGSGFSGITSLFKISRLLVSAVKVGKGPRSKSRRAPKPKLCQLFLVNVLQLARGDGLVLK